MKRYLFLNLLLLFVIVNVSNCLAQVTIGSNNQPHATLDVRSQSSVASSPDGIIAPKLAGDQLAAKDDSVYGADQDGAIVYVTAAVSAVNQTGKTVNVTEPGYYYYNYADNVWVKIGQTQSKSEWFYMPPSLINTEPGTGKTIDLYNSYITSTTSTISVVKSGAADFTGINPTHAASEYDYYVLGYDNTLFANISISTSGVMTYDIIGRATNESYITIAFAEK